MPENNELSHTDRSGRVRMVDVSSKPATERTASASARVTVGPDVFQKLTRSGFDKGDVLATAKIAGILAAKRTPELIPLCHGLAPEHIGVRIELGAPDSVLIEAEARVTAKTGIEMEVMVAASVAALTIYDMCKSASKAITIGPIRLESKQGGKSGDWRRSGN